MKYPLTLPLAAILLATQGCGAPGPVANEAEDTVILNSDEEASAPPGSIDASISEPANDSTVSPAPPPVAAAVFPAELRGRWGMVAADCDPERADNKGLITITEDSVKFYESRARIKQPRPAPAGGFAGLFAFTGEGQSWERNVTFTRDGSTLTRSDEDGSYTYRRCP